jgi:hypothetical protein
MLIEKIFLFCIIFQQRVEKQLTGGTHKGKSIRQL